uniref:Protein transport protein Sec16A n=1 Tax=Acanthochromis polyacanthus TaxID=80966 RepID=A0A3Q1FSM2_9TELE
MQPPPRTGPPGASGPPPSGPNMFRRTRPQKHTAAATATMPPAAQPMTDPFAFGRAPPPTAAGGLPTIPNSNPPPMQIPPNTMYSQPGSGLPPQPIAMEEVPAAPPGLPPSSLPGVPLFNPRSTASAGVFPAPGPTGYASSHTEQGYFNSREQTPSMPTESPPMAVAPAPRQTPFNQEFQGQPAPLTVPFQPLPPTSSPSQWAPDHGSRPPSVQNYFQPTSDPQPFNIPPQTQMYPSHSPSPHHNTSAPPTQPGHLQNQAPVPPQNPVNSSSAQWPDPNGPQQHNSHFQTQNYFSQSSAPQDSWFNQPPQDSGYHQMGTGLGHPQLLPDSAGSQPVSNTGPAPSSAPAPVPYSQESGTLSMFFKDNDVENEEILAGERNKAVNGIAGSFQHHSSPQAHGGHGDVSLDYQGASVQDHSHLPYMNDGNHPPQGNTQKPPESQFDHVENLECVPNQEVLPSETHGSPVAAAPHGVDQFETGPNLETPDSIPRPMRSASVSSNYSNMSHGSGTSSRRHQGVVGTFIQQESPRLTDDVSLSAATGGYFEQIDSSPAGDMGVQQSSLEQMWPPTPSPPKPTGIFQASANSSFEPVRSHSVGVRPAEIDRAKMVAEGGADCTPGNMEQPPDNMENIYGPGHPLPAGAGGGVPHVTHPVVHSHSRPSSRAFGASRPCESPATTLWAQNDPTSLAANILLAPAAPTVLAPLREPSADVIQPPEDCPLDLQASQRIQQTSQQHSENLENPPKVSEAEPTDSQGSLGYASLLVSGSLHQPVLIAPPVSNYSVIPPSTQAASQSSLRETTPPVRSLAQGQGANTSQTPTVTSNQNPLFAPGPISFNPSNQAPLNLTRDNTVAAVPEITAPPPSQPVGTPLSRGQSLGGDSHSAVQVNPQACLVTPTVSNHNQPSNYELLDFSMHQSQAQSQPPGHPSSLHESPQSSNGFYLQVTKDAQQGVRVEGNASVQTPAPTSAPQVPPALSQGPAAGSAAPPPPPATAYPPGPRGPVPPGPGASQPAPAEPPRPPSSAGSHQSYGPPPPPGPGQIYGGYYGNYGEYPDSRAPYPPGPYPPPPGDPRAQPYYQVILTPDETVIYEGRGDQWYGRYEGQAPGYRDPNYQYHESQPERPSSRASQYSDRPSSRFVTLFLSLSPPCMSQCFIVAIHLFMKFLSILFKRILRARKDGYEDQWRYYPGYDTSFDDEYRRRGEMYGDDFDRRSVHSEQSAHSAHSSHSHHSRRSSFSSRSQQVNGLCLFTDASQNYSSQYLYPSEYPTETTWIAPEQPPPRPATPEKFTIPHRCARFGPGGHLVQVLPNLPSAGQPALVDIHNIEVHFFSQTLCFSVALLEAFTHKVDVIKFSQNKAVECSRDNNLLDRDSARLLWDFIMLLCRQNGTVVGTDIADLLLKEHRSVWLPGKSPNEANLIDFNNEPLARAEEEPGAGPLSLLSDTFMTVPENVGKETERFRELLLFGRKKDALEAAMKGGLWGHALLLASKMDNRTHARVMTRFANSLPINDPLQTVYQLMSGRMPASATCCGEEKWGDWRPHLAMVLSNLTHTLDLDTRTITTMGDTLVSKGLNDAAHFCYLMAQVGLGVFTKKSTKMVLIGSNHSLPFYQFATNEAIQRTEAYEYAQSLGSQPCSLPNFQVYKLIYACRLAEAGLSAQAFHYCEVISRTVLMQPAYYSPVFISQIIQMSEKLRFFDPQLKEKPEQELFIEPEWLIHLRQLDGQLKFYPVHPSGPPGQIPISGYPPQDPGFAPPPFQPQPEQLEMYPGAHQQPCPPPQMGHMSPHMPPQMPHSPVQMNHPPPQMPPHMPPSPGHMPPVEQRALPEMPAGQPISSSPSRGSLTPQKDFYDQMAQMVSTWWSECLKNILISSFMNFLVCALLTKILPLLFLRRCRVLADHGRCLHLHPPFPSSPVKKRPRKSRKTHQKRFAFKHKLSDLQSASIQCSPVFSAVSLYVHAQGGGGVGWLGWIMRGRGKNEAHLPDDKNKSIVWDEKKQRWVDLNEPEEESKPPPPPPSGFPKMAPMPGPGGPPAPPTSGPSVNMFSRKAGTKSRYVDVLNPSRTAKPGGMAPAPADIFAPLAPMPMPANLFVPSSGLSRSSSMSSLSREVSQHLNQVPLAGLQMVRHSHPHLPPF